MTHTKKSQVKEAAWSLFEETGKLPTRQEIMELIGGGSARDVQAELNAWRSELADWVHHQRHRPELPDPVWSGIMSLWDTALEHATQAAQASLKEREAELEERERQAKSRVTEALDELAAERKAREDAEAELRRVSGDLIACEEKREQVAAELSEARQDLALAQQAAKESERESARLMRDMEKLRDEHRSEIKAQRKQHERDVDHWAKLVDVERQKLRDEERRNSELSERIESLLNEIADLRQEHAVAMAEARGEAERWKARYEEEVARNQEQAAKNQARLDGCQEERESILLSLSRAEERLAAATQQLDERKKEIKDLRAQVAALQKSVVSRDSRKKDRGGQASG